MKPRAINRDLESAHDHCTKNEETIRQSQQAGCFYCMAIFQAAQVTHYLEEERTALCPECGIDAVIGDFSNLAITPAFLEAMHAYWFE